MALLRTCGDINVPEGPPWPNMLPEWLPQLANISHQSADDRKQPHRDQGGAMPCRLLGPEGPSKIQEVTLMRPIHGNL